MTRNTKVLTKKPTKLSSAGSLRPAMGNPTATSGLPLSFDSSTANPAATTMKLVALCWRAIRRTCCCTDAGQSTTKLAPR
ncbi:Uncharacterised protein [Mycobacterium tuberculosis]|uniref:Uncharacterized protein n=1 Tax=Mycobacterium tuberculosis TaxID=1773 RepID=A0A655I1F0_MYCTX|nr:Uncharacterised protein [Mycobacterium tuberculosis]